MIPYEDLPRSRGLKLPAKGTKPSQAVLQWPGELFCQHSENSIGEHGTRLCAAAILAYVDGYHPMSSHDIVKACRARELESTRIWALTRCNDEQGKEAAASLLREWGQ